MDRSAKIGIFSTLAIIFFVCVILGLTSDYRAEQDQLRSKYDYAVSYIRKGSYKSAGKQLEQLGDYKDAKILVDYCIARIYAEGWMREQAQAALSRIPDSYQGEFRGAMNTLAERLSDPAAFEEEHEQWLAEKARQEEAIRQTHEKLEAIDRQRRASEKAAQDRENAKKGKQSTSSGSKATGSSGNRSAGSSKSSKSSKRYDTYDVDSYSNARDFADDKYEEFYDYEDCDDEDDAWDEAYDYWNRHH
jgi:hypothetical protein